MLEWPLVWDQDGEAAIRAPDGAGPFITWGPSAAAATVRSRLHLDIAPVGSDDRKTEVDRLVALGATRTDGDERGIGSVRMTDPEGNQFCVLARR